MSEIEDVCEFDDNFEVNDDEFEYAIHEAEEAGEFCDEEMDGDEPADYVSSDDECCLESQTPDNKNEEKKK